MYGPPQAQKKILLLRAEAPQAQKRILLLRDGAPQAQKKSFTLDPKSDHFWSEFAGKLFPEAVEGNVAERERLQKAEQVQESPAS